MFLLRFAFAIPYVLLLTALGTFWLARQYRKQRRHPGAVWLGRALEACTVWMLLDAASFLVPSSFLQEFARRLAWPAALGATLCFFRFTCAYSHHSSWWNALRIPLSAAIAADLLLMLTNPYHLLIWRGSQLIELGSLRVPRLEPGTAFYWLHTPLCYGLLLGGIVVLFIHAMESQAIDARRVANLIVAMLIPLVVNLAVVAQLTEGIDFTPVALVASFVVLARITFRYRLLQVMPAAHLLIFRRHRDGVLVIDTTERIIDANPAVARMLGADPVLGKPVDSLLPFWKQIPDARRTEGGGRVEIGHAGATIEVRSRAMRDYGGTVIGRLIVLHDISERSRLTRELAAYARTVAHDLKNPLSGAIGFIDLVKSDEPNLDPESARLLGEAQTACHRMVNIITELLRTRPGEVPDIEASAE